MTADKHKHWLGTPKPWIRPEEPEPEIIIKEKPVIPWGLIISVAIITFVWGFNFCYALFTWLWE